LSSENNGIRRSCKQPTVDNIPNAMNFCRLKTSGFAKECCLCIWNYFRLQIRYSVLLLVWMFNHFINFVKDESNKKILFHIFKNPEMLAKHEIMEYNTKNVCRVYKNFSTVYVVDDVVFRIWI
jgi:hypothetical protein